jgi:hypothetical protein
MSAWHYVITLQFEARNGGQQVYYGHGTFTPAPSQTRAGVFQQIFDQAAKAGGGSNPVPLFFSLAPNDLEAADEPAAEPMPTTHNGQPVYARENFR